MNKHRYIEKMCVIAGSLYCLLFLIASLSRLLYPYELEWNEGAVLDHAIRILEGKQLYAPPSLDFAAFVYTPFYYVVVALIIKFGGIGLWAGRLVSILATLSAAYIIGAIVHRETKSTFLASVSAMLYLAFYHATGFFFDIVRMDALALLFAIASIFTALYVKRGHLLAAGLLALAFFTKQQMIVFWPAIVLWLTLRNWREALTFSAISATCIACGTIVMNVTTHQWYGFYTLTIPSVKAGLLFSLSDALRFLPTGIFGEFAITTIVIVLGVALWGARSWLKRDAILLLYFCYLCALAGACLSLGNSGGYKNVLMPFSAIIAVLFPLSAQRLSHLIQPVQSQIALAPWLLLFEFASLAYNPFGQIALFGSAKQRAGGDQFVETIRALPGDTWIPFHGYLNRMAGKPTHIHFMAMNDVLLVQDTNTIRFRREIDRAYASHHFATIVLDENKVYPLGEIPDYSFSKNILATPNVLLSRIGDAPTRPQFLFIPSTSSHK